MREIVPVLYLECEVRERTHGYGQQCGDGGAWRKWKRAKKGEMMMNKTKIKKKGQDKRECKVIVTEKNYNA